LKAPALKLKLMEKQHQEYFSAKFFQGDVNSYYALVKKICAETDLKSALIAADNELFLLDVPTSSEPASRLLNIVRDSFEQQGNI
jgi:hypothetical protein